MFCPKCEKEFEIDGDELQELNLRNIKCPDPTCNATVSLTTLKEWVKTDTKKLKEEIVDLYEKYKLLRQEEHEIFESEISLNINEEVFPKMLENTHPQDTSKVDSRSEYNKRYEAFLTQRTRWCAETADWLEKENVISHVILNYLLAKKRIELEEKRRCQISDSRSVCRAEFLHWRSRRDTGALKTSPLLYVAPEENIYDIPIVNKFYSAVGDFSRKDSSKTLIIAGNNIWIELFQVWFYFDEDIYYLMEKAECLLATDQFDPAWCREEEAWIDLYCSLNILKPQWYKDMNRWLSCYKESPRNRKEECYKMLHE